MSDRLDKWESTSLDAIMEVIGEGESFKHYNRGKAAMRTWFINCMRAEEPRLIESVAKALCAEGETDWTDLDEGPSEVTVTRAWYREAAARALAI